MIDEKVKEHFNNVENGLGGLMEAVARAQKLGQAAWKEKEASERTAESLSWTQSVNESVSGIREVHTNLQKLSGAPEETNSNQLQKSESILAEAESIEQTARDVIESSIKALRGELGGVADYSEAARKAAETAGQLAKVASDAVDVSSKVSREALKTSLEASKEAIDRAVTISRKAREATLASSDVAGSVCETSRQTVRYAATESIQAFQKLIVQTEKMGRATNAIIEASFREFEKSLNLPAEPEPETVSVAVREEPAIVENEVEEPAASVDTKEEHPVNKTIELKDTDSRLESLVAMFNKERAS